MRFKGFTLIEILIVVAIIGVLASTVTVAINPARQFAKARDTQRETDIYSILSAVYQYSSEHNGALPDTDGDPDENNFPTSLTCIGTDVGCYDLANAGEAGILKFLVSVKNSGITIPKERSPKCDLDHTDFITFANASVFSTLDRLMTPSGISKVLACEAFFFPEFSLTI